MMVSENCEHPLCSPRRVADGWCERCEKAFCSDHGTQGGDRQVQEVGAVAFPSQCWECGGFNADA